MNSLYRFDGYLLTDHRAGPGVPELGMPHGRLLEAATFMCWHCGGHIVPNPQRVRERAYCRLCDRYICDECDSIRREADYEHIPFHQVCDMVRSRKWALAPGSTSRRPILVYQG